MASNGNGNGNGNGNSTLNVLVSRLTSLQEEANEVVKLLKTPEVAAELHQLLHDPDQLPNKQLDDLSKTVVDALEEVSLELVPSVGLLEDVFFGYLQTKALWTLIQAQVPDILTRDGPQTLKSLGLRANIQPERLSQLLDLLTNLGIFSHSPVDGLYRNSRASDLLRRDHWTQWHLWSDLYGNDFFDVSRAMPRAVKMGEHRSAAQLEYGTDMDLFEHMAEVGLMEKFHKTLGAGAVAQSRGLAVDYPFEAISREHVLDIGGGSGAFLVSVLRAHPEMTGSLMDLGSVVERVTREFREPGGSFADVGARMKELHVGDFMEDVPPSAVYTMKWCLHDWMDEDVVTVFKNVRRNIVVTPASRFLVFESVKRPGRSSRLPRYGDLIMMITVNGKERSLEDWQRLAAAGGWRIDHVYPIRRAWPCAIDLRPI